MFAIRACVAQNTFGPALAHAPDSLSIEVEGRGVVGQGCLLLAVKEAQGHIDGSAIDLHLPLPTIPADPPGDGRALAVDAARCDRLVACPEARHPAVDRPSFTQRRI